MTFRSSAARMGRVAIRLIGSVKSSTREIAHQLEIAVPAPPGPGGSHRSRRHVIHFLVARDGKAPELLHCRPIVRNGFARRRAG